MRRHWFALLLLAGLARGQDKIPVEFPQDPSRNTQLPSVSRGGIRYVAAVDIARTFLLNTQLNPETRKVDLASVSYTVRLAPGNPFLVITDAKEYASIVQLPTNVLLAETGLLVPIDAFVPVLRAILADEVAYDRSAIVVGRARSVSPFDVTGIAFEEKSNGLLIRLRCTRKIPDYESWQKPIGDNTWLYVTLANARADVDALKKIRPAGNVKQILVFQSPTAVQLTFKLKGQVTSTEPMAAEGGSDILLAVHTPTEEQLASRRAHDSERNLQKEREKWKLDVVVIDAGHGGTDPGTIGVTKTREKDITLAIALRLGKLLETNLPNVNVVYTRKTDTFVELFRRGQIANQNGGKLFISIHCNSMPHKPNPADGFEIYLLRPGKTENALRIAERENDVVKFEEGYENRYQQLTEENFILLTMAQSAYVKYSEQFANILQHEMQQHLDLPNNGVKQAGFYVLVGASMPNVLVETAYLSNRRDEKILKSAKGQDRIAEAIYGAVKRYKLEYEKSLEEGKDLGGDSR
jgi:N-acetylmuramoyl-L-alanine amidase